jgi:hypothetical protein
MKLSSKGYINELMNKEIDEFYVGIEKMGSKIAHGVNEYILRAGKLYLPAYLGGGRFLFHLTAYFTFKNENQGILLEYGGKPKGENYLPGSSSSSSSISPQLYKYGKDGGLRYQMMTSSQFSNLSDDILKLIIRVSPKPTVNSLLNSICNQSDWKRSDYNLAFHNCQDFVCKFIEKLDAVRPKFKYLRGFHNNAVAQYPYCLVKQLEKNEDDPSQVVDKIPLVGPIEETFRVLGYGIYSLFKK